VPARASSTLLVGCLCAAALAVSGCNPLEGDETAGPEEPVEVISLPEGDGPGEVRDLDYVAVDGGLRVYDIDQQYRLVETIELPDRFDAVNARGIAAGAEADLLYVSYWGEDPDSGTGVLLALDLRSKEVTWRAEYEPSVDSFALTPDGRKIYLPCSEHADCDWWFVVDALTGEEVDRITVTDGTHNTIVGRSGSRAYLASLKSPMLTVVDTDSDEIVGEVGPFQDSIRPFTVNSDETLVFVNVDLLSGFQVGDLRSGQPIHTVEVEGFPLGPEDYPEPPVTQSHGVALTPDEKEVWVTDDFYDYLHVFDVTGLPEGAPEQIADIPLSSSPKWINFTRDGRFAHVSTGEIIDTRTREPIAMVDPSRIFMEIEQRANGNVISAYSRYGLGYGRR
jgi:hypothetical protein